MIFDTHIHYNLEPLFSSQKPKFRITKYNEEGIQENEDHTDKLEKLTDWQDHWKLAKVNNVKKSLIIGTNTFYSQRALEISQQDPDLYATVGYHPSVYTNIVKQTLKKQQSFSIIEKKINEHNSKLQSFIKDGQNNILAIGEVGLDYFQTSHKKVKRAWTLKAQRMAFISQMKFAIDHNLVFSVHVRDNKDKMTAHNEIIKLLKKNYQNKSKRPFILHCISGDLNYLKKGLELGAYISFAGNITYKNSHTLREILEYVPTNKILIETDAPFLAPKPYLGQICQPWMITATHDFILDFLSHKKKIDQTTFYKNSLELFNLNSR